MQFGIGFGIAKYTTLNLVQVFTIAACDNRIAADGNNRIAADGNNRVAPA